MCFTIYAKTFPKSSSLLRSLDYLSVNIRSAIVIERLHTVSTTYGQVKFLYESTSVHEPAVHPGR